MKEKKEIVLEKETEKIDNSFAPFVKKYKNPILVHATDSKKTFLKIISDGKLKLPSDHDNQKKCPYMEKFLRVDNTIFFSLGFVYLFHHGYKFNLIFDIELLRETEYYKRPLPFKCYLRIINYWYANDKVYLKKLADYNKECKRAVEDYISRKESNSKNQKFEFWKIEKIVFDFIMRYPRRNELFRIANKTKKKLIIKYPYSKRTARAQYLLRKFPEILSYKEIDLLESPYFLGFFINDRLSVKEQKFLSKKYRGKIIFDGKKIKTL